MTTHKVGYLIGSLAKASINRRLAKALVQLAPPELEMAEISFKELPLYNYDYDSDFPPAARAFKSRCGGSCGARGGSHLIRAARRAGP